MSDGYVSLEEAREAARREVLAHVEQVLKKRGRAVEEGNARSLDSAEKRGCAGDDSGKGWGSARDDGAFGGDGREGHANSVRSIVVDVPFEAVRTIRQGEAVGDASLMRCQRMMADGRVCGLPAHDGTDQCARHYRWYSLVPNYYGLPYPENATAVQEILARVAALVLRKQIEPRIGETVARLCREMARNLGAYHREVEALRRECVPLGGPNRVQ